MNRINMDTLISHFPVLMEMKIEQVNWTFHLSLTGQLAVQMLLPLLIWQLSQQLGWKDPLAHLILSHCQGRIWALKVLPGLRTALGLIYSRLQ
jgi:hypothetical protein